MGKDKKTAKPEVAAGAGGPVVENCGAQACKAKAARFGFCSEHYEQFKFGLIRKTGEPVPDFEKKLEHYNNYKVSAARKGAKKVA